MRVGPVFGFVSVALGTFLCLAGSRAGEKEAEGWRSGPPVNAVLPSAFDCFNLSGKRAKGRHHCFVCEYGLNPVVMVLAQEPSDGKDGPLMHLLGKLDEAVDRQQDHFLKSFAVFLSPEAYSAAVKPRTSEAEKALEEAGKLLAEAEDPAQMAAKLRAEALQARQQARKLETDAGKPTPESQKLLEKSAELEAEAVKLAGKAGDLTLQAGKILGNEAEAPIEEAIKRAALLGRMEGRAAKLKNVAVGIFPENGPKGYGLAKDAAVTVIFYRKHKVEANFAYPAGKLTEEEADRIVRAIEMMLRGDEKKGEDKKA